MDSQKYLLVDGCLLCCIELAIDLLLISYFLFVNLSVSLINSLSWMMLIFVLPFFFLLSFFSFVDRLKAFFSLEFLRFFLYLNESSDFIFFLLIFLFSVG